MNAAAELAAYAVLVAIATTVPTGHWASRPDRLARRDARILASLHPVTITPANDEQRDPDYCWTCMRKCGSQPHQ